MHRTRAPRSTPAILALLCCTALAPPPSEARPRHADYVDATSYLASDADYEAWFTLRRQLRRNFDDICGDTFCEGDYSNIQSLRFVCSVRPGSGRIGSCGWSFAASEESLVPATGGYDVETQAWFCLSPLLPGTTFEALLAALAGEEPLYAALPGTTVTLYDGLVDCL